MRNTLNPIYRNLILAFSSMLIFSLFIVQYSHGATNPQTASSAAPKNCQTLLSRTEKAADSVPQVMAQFVKNEILFNYSKTFSLTSKWCNANRSNLGSKNPKRQAESGLDAVLIKDNGELRSEFELWYNLAEFQWNEILHYGFFPENIMRLLSFITKHEPSQTEFISLYAVLLREYLSAIKGSSKSLTQQYSKVFDEYKAPVGSSPFREDMKVGVPLGIAAGAGILAMHFAFGAITLVPDLVLLATAGPSATLLPSGYRLAKSLINSLQPAKYLYFYKGEVLYNELEKIFGTKLHKGYKSYSYWSLHEGVSQTMHFAYNLDLNNYEPEFTSLEEADQQLNSIVNEYMMFSDQLNKDRTKLAQAIDALLLHARDYEEQIKILIKNNSTETKEKSSRMIQILQQALRALVDNEVQANTARTTQIGLLQGALVKYAKRVEEIMPLIMSLGNASENGPTLNRFNTQIHDWTGYSQIVVAGNIQSTSTTNTLKQLSDDMAVIAALGTFDAEASKITTTTLTKFIGTLNNWRTSLLVNKSEQ